MLPREKFFQMGLDSLSDEDLVSIIIGSGIKGVSFKKVSKRVMSLLKSNNFSFESLLNTKGLGDVKSLQLLCSVELGKRIFNNSCEKKVVANSERAFEELRYIVDKKQEHLVGLFLNARYELLQKKTISIGTVDSLSISPRDIIVLALQLNSAYVILGHNHPSGSSKASTEDIKVNENIKKALDLVGIRLLDHVIVSGDGWESIN